MVGTIIRLWLVVIVLTLVSWLILKAIGKAQSVWLVLLFWVIAIFGTIGFVYGVSVWVAGQ